MAAKVVIAGKYTSRSLGRLLDKCLSNNGKGI